MTVHSTPMKREGGAEECGNLPLGDEVEQQRAETGKEQGSAIRSVR